MSTDSNPGPRVPDNSPLSAFASISRDRLTLDVVTLKKFLATDDVVFVVFAVTILRTSTWSSSSDSWTSSSSGLGC